MSEGEGMGAFPVGEQRSDLNKGKEEEVVGHSGVGRERERQRGRVVVVVAWFGVGRGVRVVWGEASVGRRGGELDRRAGDVELCGGQRWGRAGGL